MQSCHISQMTTSGRSLALTSGAKKRAYKRIAADLSDPNNILPKLIVDISISAEEPSISQWLAVYTILPKV